MPRLYVGNFDFEHELDSGPRALSRAARDLAADLVSVWVAEAEPGDFIWSPTGSPDFDFLEMRQLGVKGRGTAEQAMDGCAFISLEEELPRGPEWELVPWGWTPQLLKWGQRHRWSTPAPPINVIRHVNSRIYRAELEQTFEIAPEGLRTVRTLDELVACVRGCGDSQKWLVKANFGMAGRERLLGRGPQLEDHAITWAKRRFAQSDGLVFEPWLEGIEEAGLQWNIPEVGEPQLIGVTPLLTDSTGAYRGSRVVCTNEDLSVWATAVEMTRQLAERIQQDGYWGPLGIDAMRYRLNDGEIRLRPLQDLNARWTMGRMALGLKRLIPNGYTADWLHDRELMTAASNGIPDARVIQTTARSWLVLRPAL